MTEEELMDADDLTKRLVVAICNLVKAAKGTENNGKTQLITRVCYTLHKETPYQVQMVFNPCKMMWTDDDLIYEQEITEEIHD